MPDYEYSFMVQTAELNPGIVDMTTEQVGQGLAVSLMPVVQRASNAIQSLPPGGWEVVSHDLTRIDRHLILSFLLRRQT